MVHLEDSAADDWIIWLGRPRPRARRTTIDAPPPGATDVAGPALVAVLFVASVGPGLMGRLRNATVRALFLPVIVYLALSMIVRGLGLRLP